MTTRTTEPGGHSGHGIKMNLFIWLRKKKKLDEEKCSQDKGKFSFRDVGVDGALASLSVCFWKGLK